MLAAARPTAVKENKTHGKWNEIKKRLKAKGMLKPLANIDESQIEMDIPPFPQEIITSEFLECGFFKWKFQFLNKQINGKKVLKNTEKKDDIGGGGAAAVQQNGQNPHIGLGYRKKHRRTHAKKKQASRLRQFTKRPGFLLTAECLPIFDGLNHEVQDLHSWRLISSIRVNWKEQPQMNKKEQKLHFRSMVFTKGDPLQAVRFFSPMAVKRAKTLQIHVRVFRISKTSVISSITFEQQPGRVCLRSKGENIFVHREGLEINSPIFREQIEQGMGETVQNPIQIDEKFTPSLVRQAFRAIFSHKKIECFNVPELLDFGYVYKIGQLLDVIEDSLIQRRKCKHFPFQRKLELAYKFGLHELINTFVQRLETIEAIEGTLEKKKGMPAEFEEVLQRKLKKMKEEKEKLQAGKREMRKKSKEMKKKKQRQVGKKYDGGKMKREGDDDEADVRKGMKKLKINEP